MECIVHTSSKALSIPSGPGKNVACGYLTTTMLSKFPLQSQNFCFFWLFLSVIGVEESFKEIHDIDHDYYTLSIFEESDDSQMFNKYYVNMSDFDRHPHLSRGNGKSAKIDLKSSGFRFPFYGHFVDKAYITTHGFLSFADNLHSFMHKTQFIAPLRIKLELGSFNESDISYRISDKSMTIQWTNMEVNGHSNHEKLTFQVSNLLKTFYQTFKALDIESLKMPLIDFE